MQQLFTKEELKGKKVKYAEEIGNYFFLFFDDNTFCIFYSPDTFATDTILMNEKYKHPYSGDIAKKMVKHGIYSQEEYDKTEHALLRLRETIKRDEINEKKRKKEADDYREKYKNTVTVCCGSKNHNSYQGSPFCNECNSYCELEWDKSSTNNE